MRLALLLAALLSLGLSCAGQSPPPGAPGSGTITVSLQVVQIAPEGERPVAPGTALQSGAALSLRVAVDRPAYLYVAQVPPRGSVEALYPQGGERALAPGAPLRIPGEGHGLVLEGPPGEEVLHVIAAVRPLARIDPALCESYHLPCGGRLAEEPAGPLADTDKARPPPPPPPPPPPQTADITRRGDRVTWVAQEGVLRGTSDRGVIHMRFAFRHE